MNLNRALLTFYVLLFVGLGLGGAYLFLDARAELRRLAQVQAQNRARLAEVQRHLAEQEKVLERLRNDPYYVDKVIRKRLGYAKPDEFIFRFPD